jgi:hypothetical protein
MLSLLVLCLSTLLCKSLTISGLSSGGFFTSQFYVAHSQSIKGAAIIAGGPYWCTQGSYSNVASICNQKPSGINITTSINYATAASNAGNIDNVSNLATANVYIYSGTLDTIVLPGVVAQTVAFFQHFITSGKLVSNFSTPSEHAWITDVYGNACPYLGSPYISNCQLDTAGIMLQQFYGTLQPRVAPISSNLQTFLQTQYGDVQAASMSNIGYVYVPTGCKTQKCEVHVSFHGCLQAAEVIGNKFVAYNGLNNWAESNNIVVIYPQITAQTGRNPNGCWDFWGFTGSDFALKSAKQISIVFAMVNNVPGVSW